MNRIVVLVGPSFSGKTTVSNILRDTYGFYELVSTTTRSKRPGEVEGVDYHFVDHDTFEQDVQADAFVEHVTYAGNMYGLHKQRVQDALDNKDVSVVVMNMEGAQAMKLLYPNDVVTVFIAADYNVLMDRAMARDDKPETIMNRLKKAKEELLTAHECDYMVKNHDLAKTVELINFIVRCL